MRERGRRRLQSVLAGALTVGLATSIGLALQWGRIGDASYAAPQQIGAGAGVNAAVDAARGVGPVRSLDGTSGSADATPSIAETASSEFRSPDASASTSSGTSSTTEPGPVRADGSVDATAYRELASSMATPAGIAYRFGNASTASTDGRPTAAAPQTKTWFNAGANKQLTYQVGGPADTSNNDFSNNQGQVGYLSDGRSTFGADTIETLSMDANTFSEQPRLAWQFYGGGHPAPELVNGQTAKCLQQLGVKPGNFVAQARSYAHGEATANSLMVFDNGVIAAAGTNTAPGKLCLQLPSILKPTAISITNQNEFALVTVWNIATMQSELAVIALGGTQPRGQFWDLEWTSLYPGLENYGMPTFGKFLGTVPLPMATATGVSAVSDYSAGDWLQTPGGQNVNRMNLPLTDEANRQSFITGRNADHRATAGYAVVFSREEHKVAFVDLQPLFDQITDSYFKSRSLFDSVSSNVGQGATQWPYSFSAQPSERPQVVKTITTAQAPTAVAAMLSGAKTPRAYVATADGTLHTWYVGGLATDAPVDASQITERGSIQVGSNPTNITYVKDRPGNVNGLDTQLIVTSRGDRAIQWVGLSGDGGKVIRTLRDSRLVDPIAAEDNNTHGTESYLVSIADYGAGRVFTFRFGSVDFHTNGGAAYGIAGGGEFEYGGSYDPQGKPFSISITNVS